MALVAPISPMLATPGPLPVGPGWAYEFKWDGVRAISYVERLEELPLDISPIFADGPTTVAAADEAGLEGVVAKRRSSRYRPGRRSPDWIKVPFIRTQEVVIVGYQPGEGRRAGTIGALLLAVNGPDGQLHFAGGVGTGFTDAALRALHRTLEPLRRTAPPLSGVPREHARRRAVWVEPSLVGEVAYRTWTPDGRLRHPSWRGLRPDKAPADVTVDTFRFS
jgi:bifunctional non-homologous end joining protein LigD